MAGKPDHDYGTKERKVDVDITVYGATGVVSQHVLAYLTQVSVSLPRKLTVTLAGRNKTKLRKLRERMEQKMTLLKEAKGGVDSFCIFDVFVADCQDSKALLAMAKRTRVVLNCAGPFRFYGTKVVQACAETGAHYTDISDETVWAGEMRARYGPSAAESGARIVSFCGFDSVPSDIAVYVAFKALKDECKEKSVDIAKATTWYTCQGGFTSGIILGRLQRKFNYRNLLHLIPYFEADPLVLTHPKIRADPDMETTRRRFALGEWINQLPATHSIFRFGVTLPFFLASVNFKVVYATAVALKYGRNFVYRERFVPAGFKFTHHFGPVSLIPALLTQIYLLIWNMVLRMPILGFRIASWLFPPGTGLSERCVKSEYLISSCSLCRVVLHGDFCLVR